MKDIYTTKEWAALKERVRERKQEGQKLVFTNGCFDVIHPGHEALLAFARKQGGICVLGMNSDSSVKKLKGADRPVNSEEKRAQDLLKTGYVDAIVIFDEDTPQELVDFLEPEILIKGDDYRFETIVGAPEVLARGGKVLVFKKVPGYSTTEILHKEKINIETNRG
ncbi:MAG: adenylyltransferase/cytidyltransferase family protein [Candidatus Marinimicrobia bacterium]|nr:adenylyltransferase/cytidyltransferase family protein [Candidatus Neomarinimicrobiota bacterium]